MYMLRLIFFYKRLDSCSDAETHSLSDNNEPKYVLRLRQIYKLLRLSADKICTAQNTKGGLKRQLISASSSKLEGAMNAIEGRTQDWLIYLVPHSLFTPRIISSVPFCLSYSSQCAFCSMLLSDTQLKSSQRINKHTGRYGTNYLQNLTCYNFHLTEVPLSLTRL